MVYLDPNNKTIEDSDQSKDIDDDDLINFPAVFGYCTD